MADEPETDIHRCKCHFTCLDDGADCHSLDVEALAASLAGY
jgi:hypothetical protein